MVLGLLMLDLLMLGLLMLGLLMVDLLILHLLMLGLLMLGLLKLCLLMLGMLTLRSLMLGLPMFAFLMLGLLMIGLPSRLALAQSRNLKVWHFRRRAVSPSHRLCVFASASRLLRATHDKLDWIDYILKFEQSHSIFSWICCRSVCAPRLFCLRVGWVRCVVTASRLSFAFWHLVCALAFSYRSWISRLLALIVAFRGTRGLSTFHVHQLSEPARRAWLVCA